MQGLSCVSNIIFFTNTVFGQTVEFFTRIIKFSFPFEKIHLPFCLIAIGEWQGYMKKRNVKKNTTKERVL